MKPDIGILFGGRSSEYDVSLHSAAAVLTHIDRERYTPVCIGITREGVWYLYEGPVEAIENDTWHTQACTPALLSPSTDTRGLWVQRKAGWETISLCAVFPILHGRNGEDGTVQGLLELADLPIVGCGSLCAAVCMDKEYTHLLANAAGIEPPRSVTLYAYEDPGPALAAAQSFSYPLFVKPARAGSSFGITRVTQAAQLPKALADAFLHDDKLLIEEGVDGVEIGCAVLGLPERPIIATLDEVALTDGFFDYEEKYTLKTSSIHVPARLPDVTTARAKHIAQTLYQKLGCKGLSRIDLFVTKDGRILLNEVNTIPGFTAHSRYPHMFETAGVPFDTLIDLLITQALEETRA